MVPSIYHTVFCDLIEYRNLKAFNKNYSYILVVIDAFSRYAWTRPLKNKEAKTCAEALDDIFSTFKHIPAFFASGKLTHIAELLIYLKDAGNEFNPKNKYIKEVVIKKFGIHMYIMKGRTKGSIGKFY